MRNFLCRSDNVLDKSAWKVTSRRQDNQAMAAATRLLVPRGPMALARLQDKEAMLAATRHLVPSGPEARDRLQDKEQQQLLSIVRRQSSPSWSRPCVMESKELVESSKQKCRPSAGVQ